MLIVCIFILSRTYVWKKTKPLFTDLWNWKVPISLLIPNSFECKFIWRIILSLCWCCKKITIFGGKIIREIGLREDAFWTNFAPLCKQGFDSHFSFYDFSGFNIIVPWPRACYRVSSISLIENSMSIAYRRARPLWFKGIKSRSPIIASNACRYKCHTISLNSFFLTILMVSARKMMISRPLSGSSDFPGTDTSHDTQFCRSFVNIFTIYSLITDREIYIWG